jgi:hypothetical protein
MIKRTVPIAFFAGLCAIVLLAPVPHAASVAQASNTLHQLDGDIKARANSCMVEPGPAVVQLKVDGKVKATIQVPFAGPTPPGGLHCPCDSPRCPGAPPSVTITVNNRNGVLKPSDKLQGVVAIGGKTVKTVEIATPKEGESTTKRVALPRPQPTVVPTAIPTAAPTGAPAGAVPMPTGTGGGVHCPCDTLPLNDPMRVTLHCPSTCYPGSAHNDTCPATCPNATVVPTAAPT